jgi:hypothetical protein
MLGDRVLVTSTPRRGSTVTIVRRGSLGFVAHSLEGRCVANLARKMPARDALFSRSMDQLRREMAAREDVGSRLTSARDHVVDLQAAIAAAGSPSRSMALLRLDAPGSRAQESRSRVLSQVPTQSWWRVVWSWMQRLWIWVLKRTLPPTATRDDLDAQLQQERDTVCALERELDGMPTKEQMEAHVERLRQEREAYESERRATFLSLVREVDGTDIAERIIEYPADCLAEDLTLVDLPCPTPLNASAVGQVWTSAIREIDALVLVADVKRTTGNETTALVREMKKVAPLVLVVLNKAAEVHTEGAANASVTSTNSRARTEAFGRVVRHLAPEGEGPPCVVITAEPALEGAEHAARLGERLRSTMGRVSQWLHDARPEIMAFREAIRIKTGASEVLRAEASEEESCRKRLSALESKPIPDPTELRQHLLTRVENAIAQGADDVLAHASGRLHEEFQSLRAQWLGQIASCTGRNEVEACAKAINESAPQSIAAALERTAEHVARELQELSETLESWALAEIHTQYQLVRRIGVEALSPVASELTRDDLETELGAMRPADGALDAFERQRVGYGLGGVAAGAMLGTLIAPGIGTAVGAVIGVFVGLLKGVDSLKQECIDKVRTCLEAAENHARNQLANKKPDFSKVVRVTLDEGLDSAFRTLGDAIERLKTIERDAIERERARLADLTASRLELERCHAHLTSLTATTACLTPSWTTR